MFTDFDTNLFKIDNSFSYTAIIIEPRNHRGLEYVVGNILDSLDKSWKVIIFHGSNNISFIHQIKDINLLWKDAFQSGRLVFIELPNQVKNLTIYDYNQLLYNRWLYDQIPTDLFLIFQVDSGICSSNKHFINKWIEEPFDYMGAPWKHEYHPIHGHGGNGGFSLRRKSKMLHILDSCPLKKPDYASIFNEDTFFAYGCSEISDSMNLPDLETSKQFSTETIYSDSSFGFHKPWANLSTSDFDKFINHCPESKIVFDLFRT